MKFRSKIDWWFYLVLISTAIFEIGLATWLFCIGLLIGAIPVCVIFLIMYAFLFIPISVNTIYVFDDCELRVMCGIFKPTRIAYTSILRVERTKNSIASPALSLDRLSITFEDGTVLISPKSKKEFLKQLRIKVGSGEAIFVD